MTDYEQLTILSRAEWRRWLENNHDTTSGVWLVRFKKGRGPHFAYDDVVEEALAVGWVDSRPRRLDDERSQLLVTRRKKGSRWSRANKTQVANLRQRDLMTPAGEAAGRRAHDDGTWDALDPVEALLEPDDLRDQLDVHPPHADTGARFRPPLAGRSWRPSSRPREPSASTKPSGKRRSTYAPTNGASPALRADPQTHRNDL